MEVSQNQISLLLHKPHFPLIEENTQSFGLEHSDKLIFVILLRDTILNIVCNSSQIFIFKVHILGIYLKTYDKVLIIANIFLMTDLSREVFHVLSKLNV
jgi:hypothetical protein